MSTPIVGLRMPATRLAWQLPIFLALAGVAVLAVGAAPELVLPLYLAAVSGELCRCDFAEHRLPNSLVVPGYAFAAVQLLWSALASGRMPWVALAAGAGWFVLFLALNLAGGMGMGDVKLVGLIAVALGSVSAVAAVAGPLIAFMAGGVVGLVALVSSSTEGMRRIPFGPYLLVGYWAALAGTSALG